MLSMVPRPSQIGMANVVGHSMTPTLRHGDRLLVVHRARPRLHDVVVVRLPPDDRVPRPPFAVKRLAARHPDGRLWVTSDGVGTDSTDFGSLDPGALIAVAVLRLPGRGRGLRWLRPRR